MHSIAVLSTCNKPLICIRFYGLDTAVVYNSLVFKDNFLCFLSCQAESPSQHSSNLFTLCWQDARLLLRLSITANNSQGIITAVHDGAVTIRAFNCWINVLVSCFPGGHVGEGSFLPFTCSQKPDGKQGTECCSVMLMYFIQRRTWFSGAEC